MAFFLQKTGKALERDEVKELFIAVGFGGSTYGWMQEHLDEPVELDGPVGDWLYSFEAAMADVRSMLIARHPAEYKLLKGRRNPAASLAYFVYADIESKARRKMTLAIDEVGKVSLSSSSSSSYRNSIEFNRIQKKG